MVLNLPLTLLTADHNEGRYDEKGLKSCRTSCSSCLFLGTVPPQEECRPPKITNCQIKSDNMAARTRSGSLQKFSGTQCKTTSSRQILQNTAREREHYCSECGRSFTLLSSLRVHHRIHTGEKPFHCPECGKSFNQGSHLRTHQRIHTGEKPRQCSVCGKRFSRPRDLQQHQRIHTGEKPYHCSDCGRNFTVLNHLQKHQRIHTGAKPYYCSDCGQLFRHTFTLNTHKCSKKEVMAHDTNLSNEKT